MAVDGCGLVCKYIIIIFDCIFAVVGIASLAFGLYLRFGPNSRPLFEMEELSSTTFVIGVTVMIVLGAVMLVVVTFGEFGACSENRSSLQVFSCLVAMLAGTEIVIGILAYTNSDKVAEGIKEFYASLYLMYKTTGDPAMGIALKYLHQVFHCCGLTGVRLEDLFRETCPNPKGLLEVFKLPDCPTTIASVFDSRAPIVMGTFIGTGALLVIVLFCSITLSKTLRVATSSPEYIILNPPTPSSNAQAPQTAFLISSSYPPPDQEPVVFTPLTDANIPVGQA